jgi:hypothetical protein
MPKDQFKQEVERELTRAGNGTVEDYLLQVVPDPDSGH